jgi:hypothetical protein
LADINSEDRLLKSKQKGMMDMKAKVTLFKVRVKEASKVLSVADISEWMHMEQNLNHYSDIRKTTGDAVLDDLNPAATKVIYISVN